MGKSQKFRGIIGVIGGSCISPSVYDQCVDLGKEIAQQGYYLVCGGLTGTMEAVCKGIKEMNGFSIGILPYSEKINANPFVDLVIPTGFGEARNFIIVNTSDGIISVAGESGTLIELSYAWRMKKPIVALITTGGWSKKLGNERIDDSREDRILAAIDPKEAVQLLIHEMHKK